MIPVAEEIYSQIVNYKRKNLNPPSRVYLGSDIVSKIIASDPEFCNYFDIAKTYGDRNKIFGFYVYETRENGHIFIG
jgi:hypothetical protein